MRIASATLRNLLSFGREGVQLELRPLNVLIGPNGSGKSNLIESLDLMRSTDDWQRASREGGGVKEWIWKGNPESAATISLIFEDLGFSPARKPVRHELSFRGTSFFEIADERIENVEPSYPGADDVFFYYRYQNGKPVLSAVAGQKRQLKPETIVSGRSVLGQIHDPEQYPEMASIRDFYTQIRIYREWTFGRSGILRKPQAADLRNDVLAEDFSNLGMFLNRIRTKYPQAKQALVAALRDVYDGVTDFDVFVEGGTVQLFLHEGSYAIPATRLSDGTIRYLCLLAILFDPAPPPLVCIEEPELGLHPDLITSVARHLQSLAERTQVIITTHSVLLVDALSESPESIVVCEKEQEATALTRLSAKELEPWLDEYGLGQLWSRGSLGGNRW
jgi:predicted ATPase